MNPAIFREYDIRGVAERDFDAGFAASLGRAFGTLAGEAGRRRVSVGRDCRLTSDRYAAAVADGIRSTGLTVVDIGVCPTPLLYFSLFHWDLDGGIQVTGSHNAADYNGFKVCLGQDALYGEQIQDLRRRIEAGRFRQGAGATEIRPVGPVYQAGTLSGNPLAMAAGLATLRHLKKHPEIYQQLERRTALLVDKVMEGARKKSVPLMANRVGSMFTWFFQPGEVHDWDTAAKSDTARFGNFYRSMLERGIYLPPSQFEAVFVGAAHSLEDIHRTVEAAEASL